MTKNIQKLTEKEYRAYDLESFSSIKYILDSPKTFLYYKETPFKGSSSSLLGTCIHNYLQGNQHLVAFQPLPNLKKNKEALEIFEKEFRDKTGEDGIIVPKAFEAKLEKILQNAKEHKSVMPMLAECVYEKAYIVHIDGIQLKGKVDGVAEDYILEIKSSMGGRTQAEFKEEAIDRHYDMQAYLYQQAVLQNEGKLKKHFFVVINTTEPFKVALYASSPEFLKSGERKAKEAVHRYKKYIMGKEAWNEAEVDGEI